MALKDKRYGVTIGFAIYPAAQPPLYAGPHHYGKMKYEDVVIVQNIVSQYQKQLLEMMEPMVEELKELGFTAAAAVSGERDEAPKVSMPGGNKQPPGAIR